MPLILRSNLNRRLTQEELDGNFTYLESISGGTGSGGTGSVGPQGPAGATGPQGIQGPTGSGGGGLTGSPNQVLYFDEVGDISSSGELIKLENGFGSVEYVEGDQSVLIVGSVSQIIPNGAILGYTPNGSIGAATWSLVGVVPGEMLGAKSGPAALIAYLEPDGPPTTYIAVHQDGIDINGPRYQFPSSQGSGPLTNDGSGGLTWSAGYSGTFDPRVANTIVVENGIITSVSI